MGFLIGLLTFILVLDCLFLILLVLIQLPKKEAGAGVAFGGAATDALFGAGTGTVLTRITKYAAATFFGLAIVLGLLQSAHHRRTTREFERQLQTQSQQALPGTPSLPPAGTPAGVPSATVPGGSPGAPVTSGASTAPSPSTTGTNVTQP
ncbi:preprotein translocase subunit SecG [Limisphaera sp. VF-2]|jgi:preprotein translocase subunit SecG|uniref:preprotein translocase subunit SecG n=1 Tax=Limisphaera sp. VF-2 TaxID=3400418 RepID=UPI001770E2C4|nr:preprotein translocase subunit SecG [Limisphaera sp.]